MEAVSRQVVSFFRLALIFFWVKLLVLMPYPLWIAYLLRGKAPCCLCCLDLKAWQWCCFFVLLCYLQSCKSKRPLSHGLLDVLDGAIWRIRGWVGWSSTLSTMPLAQLKPTLVWNIPWVTWTPVLAWRTFWKESEAFWGLRLIVVVRAIQSKK